ncbi:anthranilate phosphoribosyltransferase [Zymomonas mobilis]|uniref:anthranilate phosphoribosyltransferase n=1 Tax=Zymomonas mobilis TaxID=542 RepID=UPI0021C3FA74|nr:anthranilate phosphoribosyltransferase [Zymomonas mobilis]MCP9308614.1 anthranilate phosphoribosyltransferase [Zymomonas mobilis]
MTSVLPDPTRPLSFDEARKTFGEILDGFYDKDDLAAFLIAMSKRGESGAEIAGAAKAAIERMVTIKAPEDTIDVCGTGGDGQNSLNISTAVSLVVAATHIPVAKHGNRASSSMAGAADTLEALGVKIDLTPKQAEHCLKETGITFLFAPTYHPALVELAPLRRKIGQPTIFNLIGPLANPAQVSRQLIGLASPRYFDAYSEAISLLGLDTVLLVSGDDPLDEVSISKSSTALMIRKNENPNSGLPAGRIRIKPADVNLDTHPISSIRGGNADYNAQALLDLLAGKASAYRDAVLINAAGALIVAEKCWDWDDGVNVASNIIDSGRASQVFEAWKKFSQNLR